MTDPGPAAGGPPPTAAPATFPGTLSIVDRSPLYQPTRNQLGNGAFEQSSGGLPTRWELTTVQGSPTVDLGPGNGGQALRVTHDAGDLLVAASEFVPVDTEALRYYVAFEVRTDFGVVDESWTAFGTDEELPSKAELSINAVIRFRDALGTDRDQSLVQSLHALDAWRPFLAGTFVPRTASEVQVRFQIGGNVPNATAAHTTRIDNVRLFAEPAELAPVPLVGSGTEGGGGTVDLVATGGGYRVELSYVPSAPGSETDGQIVGELVNQSGGDAAVDLVYATEFDAVGGRIAYDVSRSEAITTEQRYFTDTVEADVYSQLEIATVPLGSVTDDLGETRGFALPLATPRVFSFRYDSTERRYELVQPIGLDANGPGARVAVDFRILDSSDRWGYRDLWLRYSTQLEADALAVERATRGGTGAFLSALFDDDDSTPKVSDVAGLIEALQIRWVLRTVSGSISPADTLFTTLETYDLELMQYDFPWALRDGSIVETAPPPTYDAIAQLVEESRTEDSREAVQADGVLLDSRGTLLVNRVAAGLLTPGVWAVRLPTYLDPSRSGYEEAVFDEQYSGAFAAGLSAPATSRQRLTGLYLDGFFKESRVLDERSGVTSTAPLTYDPNTGRPAGHLAADHVAYLRSVRQRLTAEVDGSTQIAGNATSEGIAMFGWPELDIAAWESLPTRGVNFGHADLNARRMLMPGKQLGAVYNTDWCSEPELVLRRYFQTLMLLAIYPGMVDSITPPPCLVTQSTRRGLVEDLHREALPVLESLTTAGWQVIPYATLADANGPVGGPLRVERFGVLPPYYFSVLNNPSGLVGDETATRIDAVLTIELAPLFLGGSAEASVLYGDVVLTGSTADATELELRFSLEPGEGAVFEVR